MCEISPELTKNLPKKGCLQDFFDSEIHSWSCEESDYSGSGAVSDAEF